MTCSDQGIEMAVVTIDASAGLARCTDPDGALSQVEIGLLDSVEPGARLIVHAGTAIGRLSGAANAHPSGPDQFTSA
jgi:hydrogenase maturation factor